MKTSLFERSSIFAGKYVLNMRYLVNWGGGNGVFAVPDAVADSLKLAGGKAVKVLLYILKNKISDIDLSEVGKAVGVTEEDVEDALSYWQHVGIIYADGTAPADIRQRNNVKSESMSDVKDMTAAKNEHEKAAKMISPEEIAERVKNSDDIKFLFRSAEASFGRLLNYTEQRTLLWLRDYCGMAPDILLMIIDFSVQINKANISYIEKIAMSWHNKGITTHKQASDEMIALQKYFSLEGQIVAKLGLDRTLTPTEKKFIQEWADKGFSIDLIVYSYEKTIDNIGKVKFSYMNKILFSWQEKGISTVAAAKTDTPESSGSPVSKKSSKTAYPDSDKHSYDLDRLVEHAMNNTPKI